jgi:hypothetical protein
MGTKLLNVIKCQVLAMHTTTQDMYITEKKRPSPTSFLREDFQIRFMVGKLGPMGSKVKIMMKALQQFIGACLMTWYQIYDPADSYKGSRVV